MGNETIWNENEMERRSGESERTHDSQRERERENEERESVCVCVTRIEREKRAGCERSTSKRLYASVTQRETFPSMFIPHSWRIGSRSSNDTRVTRLFAITGVAKKTLWRISSDVERSDTKETQSTPWGPRRRRRKLL